MGKMFYINYMECKLRVEFLSKKNYLGFILTIWNVN